MSLAFPARLFELIIISRMMWRYLSTVASRRALSLKQLWDSVFSSVQQDADLKCPRHETLERCGARGARVYFLEREPPILFISLRRGYLDSRRNHRKDTRAVSFPQTLNWLRSSEYRFAGVIRHVGDRPNHGHYTSNVLLGPRDDGVSVYAHCNDSSVSLHLWQDL